VTLEIKFQISLSAEGFLIYITLTYIRGRPINPGRHWRVNYVI